MCEERASVLFGTGKAAVARPETLLGASWQAIQRCVWFELALSVPCKVGMEADWSCGGCSRNGVRARALDRSAAGRRRRCSPTGRPAVDVCCVVVGTALATVGKTAGMPVRRPSWLFCHDAVAIWLILPVVICLSQRLSHACLSTYFHTVKPRMAH